MDLEQILRSQAKRYKCVACGQSMAECGINILAQQGNRALVRVTCNSCTDENLLQIIFQTEDDLTVPVARPKLFDEPVPEFGEAITTDEMLDLRKVLQQSSGGFKELLKAK